MTSPVIVGFDGSAPSRAAVDFGAAEAERRNRPLHLCHAFTWPLLYPMADPADAPPDHGPRVRSLELLNETADEVRRARPGLSVAARLLDGSPGGVLVSASADAGLLVVGHRGLGGFTGLLAGSVGVQVAGHARCPVVVVRGAPVADGAPIVVGVDGSAGAHLAAVAAFEQAQQQGVELFHLQVCASETRRHAPLIHEPVGRSAAAVDDPAEDLDSLPAHYPGVTYQRGVVHGEHPAAALIAAADRVHAGMIVVGSRGLGGFRGLVMGSTSRSLIEHAPCPVMIVPPAATAAG
ncbi:universal stress protein [Dactylosporangium sp. NBC_01737]|uniref:universal stress protein n=1 Tax=Dactylosporangium sp. NBC_01737 TaxID=2975959 RepID=UPI002E117364|nr:universal stress protein [Dactylosporangium sp. NBC_01737]